MNKEDKIARLTDLLIYALLPKRIYNHELDVNTMNKFIEIVSNNLRYDTHTIRQKLVDCWDSIGKENRRDIFKILDEENK